MPRLNNIFLYGYIENKPRITYNQETEEPVSAICYLHVVRGYRDDHSGKQYLKHDFPLIIALEERIIKEMETWEEFDLVHVKGTLSTRYIDKPSYCPTCGQQNIAKGIMMFITPIYVDKERECMDKKEALKYIIKGREISNQAYAFGTLIKDPTYFKTNAGTIITQYQLALERKFRIRTDDPSVRVDWPWVKSYGEQAIEDKMRLRKGSEIYLDGILQARTVHRKTKCEKCEQIYPWDDHTLELVPYDVEYVTGHMTDERLIEEEHVDPEELRQQVAAFEVRDKLSEEVLTEDVDEESIEGDDTE